MYLHWLGFIFDKEPIHLNPNGYKEILNYEDKDELTNIMLELWKTMGCTNSEEHAKSLVTYNLIHISELNKTDLRQFNRIEPKENYLSITKDIWN
jgi:hypothetical protein